MDRFISFRAGDAFRDALRSVAVERGVPVSRLIRDAVEHEISLKLQRAPDRQPRQQRAA